MSRELPLWAAARFENSQSEPCLFPAEAGIVFTALAAIGNLIETKHQGNYGRKNIAVTVRFRLGRFRRLVKRNVKQKENACQEIYKKITFISFILTGFDENE